MLTKQAKDSWRKRRARANAHQLFASEPSLLRISESVCKTALTSWYDGCCPVLLLHLSDCVSVTVLCLGYQHTEAALVDESCSHSRYRGGIPLTLPRSSYSISQGADSAALPESDPELMLCFPGPLRALGCTGGLLLLPNTRGWTIGSWGCRPLPDSRLQFHSSRKYMRR